MKILAVENAADCRYVALGFLREIFKAHRAYIRRALGEEIVLPHGDDARYLRERVGPKLQGFDQSDHHCRRRDDHRLGDGAGTARQFESPDGPDQHDGPDPTRFRHGAD
mgnify:CR=1 FL=1